MERAPLVKQTSGLADEGGELKALVQRMDLEDQDYMTLSEDEESNDEDTMDNQAVSSEWNTYKFNNLVVNEGSRVPCKEAVQEAVKF